MSNIIYLRITGKRFAELEMQLLLIEVSQLCVNVHCNNNNNNNNN